MLFLHSRPLRPAVPGPWNVPLIFTQFPHQPRIPAPIGQFIPGLSSRVEGSRLVVILPSGKLTVLTPEFAAAADPSVAPDGKRVLFSGKRRTQDHWDIWEMEADGRNKRQITSQFGECGEPRYLAMSALNYPDYDEKVRWITFSSNVAGTFEERGAHLATALYVRSLDPIKGRGYVTWRITFNLSSDFSPTVLNDGRTLFVSHQMGDSEEDLMGRYLLLVSNWDGTGLNLFCGDEQGAKMKTMACEIPDQTLVYETWLRVFSRPESLRFR